MALKINQLEGIQIIKPSPTILELPER
jgi:hypothetical protein